MKLLPQVSEAGTLMQQEGAYADARCEENSGNSLRIWSLNHGPEPLIIAKLFEPNGVSSLIPISRFGPPL